jgi:hypothetical protein
MEDEWTIEKFVIYMTERNYKYEIVDSVGVTINRNNCRSYRGDLRLKYIDHRCKIVHLPIELKYINSMYKADEFMGILKLNTLIIPLTITKYAWTYHV